MYLQQNILRNKEFGSVVARRNSKQIKPQNRFIYVYSERKYLFVCPDLILSKRVRKQFPDQK